MELQEQKDCLCWLLNTSPVKLQWTSALDKAASKAAAEGRIQVLEYLAVSVQKSYHIAGQPDGLGTNQCIAAAEAGQVAVLAWLDDHIDGDCWTPSICQAAVRGSQMEALQWLCCVCSPPCACNADVLEEAAGQGKLDFIKFLRSTQPPCPWGPSVCSAAVRYPDCLKFMRQQDPPCPWHAAAMTAAAKQGDLELMKWMRQGVDPCPWHDQCTAIAAETGDLSMLQWLRTQTPDPCPLAWSCMKAAASRGDLDMVKWMHAQDPEEFGIMTMLSAIMSGHVEVVKWLRQQSCPWSPADILSVIRRGSNELVQWLLSQEEPYPWHPDAPNEYAAAGNLTMLRWLHQAGYYITPDPKAAVSAAISGNTEVLAWLLGHEAQASDQLDNWDKAHWNENLIRHSMYTKPWPVPTLMLWGSYQQPLTADLGKKLQLAWASYCAFHGLIRWQRNQVSMQSSGTKSAMNAWDSSHHPGQQLLIHLSRLPHDLVVKIAISANLQHDQVVVKQLDANSSE